MAETSSGSSPLRTMVAGSLAEQSKFVKKKIVLSYASVWTKQIKWGVENKLRIIWVRLAVVVFPLIPNAEAAVAQGISHAEQVLIVRVSQLFPQLEGNVALEGGTNLTQTPSFLNWDWTRKIENSTDKTNRVNQWTDDSGDEGSKVGTVWTRGRREKSAVRADGWH